MHRIRPALQLTAQLALFLFLTGCAGARTPGDPLEPFNRGVYKFNDTVDKAVVKPVAQAYDTVMPTQLRIMAGNFISNLDDILVTLNDVLQLKFDQAASDGSRFILNSTFGVFGLFNFASGLEKHHEDFGQTLGYWGVGSGPYLVLPFLGPSSMRDAPGLYVDTLTAVEGQIDNIRTRNQYYAASFVHKRADLLDGEKVLDEAAIDRYAFIRDAYLQHRKSKVYDGNPPREKYDFDE
ncbi:MAG: VacJ family lipoprotein [Gallionella sp.]|nr:VacJ family lipoprotein [Gallionella sp.]MDH4285910.1 VacJ family lipoprotein [Gallionella sp.]